MFKLKSPFIITLILCSSIAGFLVSGALRPDSKSTAPVFRLNEIRKVKQLKLVTYHFEEIIPIEKNGRIKLLLIVPATVSGFIDLDNMQYEILNDTIVSVNLPRASIDSASFSVEDAVNYDLEKKFSVSLGTGLYQEVFDELKSKLKSSKIHVTQKALELGLQKDTESAAREYIGVLLADLKYLVQFNE